MPIGPPRSRERDTRTVLPSAPPALRPWPAPWRRSLGTRAISPIAPNGLRTRRWRSGVKPYMRPISKMLAVSEPASMADVVGSFKGAACCDSSAANASTGSPSARKNLITNSILCCRDSLSGSQFHYQCWCKQGRPRCLTRRRGRPSRACGDAVMSGNVRTRMMTSEERESCRRVGGSDT